MSKKYPNTLVVKVSPEIHEWLWDKALAETAAQHRPVSVSEIVRNLITAEMGGEGV